MSARVADRPKSKSKPQPQTPPAAPVEPLKPQRKLFIGLLMVLAIWIGVLLALFFLTIYPQTHRLH